MKFLSLLGREDKHWFSKFVSEQDAVDKGKEMAKLLRGETEKVGGHQYCVVKRRVNQLIDKNTGEAWMNSKEAREKNQVWELRSLYDEQHGFQTKYYAALSSQYNAGEKEGLKFMYRCTACEEMRVVVQPFGL